MSDWERVRNRVGTREYGARGRLRRAAWSAGSGRVTCPGG